jgi:tetratricopeptide (TPR) repeat protein
MRISPVDTRLHVGFAGMGAAFIELRRFDDAIVAAKKACVRPPYSPAYRCLASAFAHLGRYAEARDVAARMVGLDPAFTISAWIARGGQSNAKLVIEAFGKRGYPNDPGSIRFLLYSALALTLRATDDYSFAELCLMFGDYNAAAAASGAFNFVF